MSKRKKFVIWSPPFDEHSGGIIVLHYLCDLINSLGREAYMFRADLVYKSMGFDGAFNSVWSETFSRLKAPARGYFRSTDTVVIYPEIVAGNPLGAENVVRWCLNKPGTFTGVVDFGRHDLIFTYQDIFDNTNLPQVRGGTLWVLYYLKDIYKQSNFGKREGECYLIKKGAHKIKPQHLKGKLIVDGLSHTDRAFVFNQCETLISYDSASMLSWYAALCGCSSIVIPDEGVNQDMWQPDLRYRMGISYGSAEASIDWARNTREKLPALIADLERDSLDSVKNFIFKCDQYFKN